MEPKRVMVIDDETGFTKLVKLNLENTGHYQVRVVNDPLTVVAAAREFKPDLILLDIVMPDKDGGALVLELQADEQLKGVPIVFLTAAITRQVATALKGAIHGFPIIAKPVTPKELIRRLDEMLAVPYFTLQWGWGKKAGSQPSA